MQAWGATSVELRACQQQGEREKVKSHGKGRQVSGRPNKCSLVSTLYIETLKLGSKGSGDSVLVLMHVTYLAHLLYIMKSSASPQISPV